MQDDDYNSVRCEYVEMPVSYTHLDVYKRQGVYLLIQSKIRQAKKFRRDAEYGTARFGTCLLYTSRCV